MNVYSSGYRNYKVKEFTDLDDENQGEPNKTATIFSKAIQPLQRHDLASPIRGNPGIEDYGFRRELTRTGVGFKFIRQVRSQFVVQLMETGIGLANLGKSTAGPHVQYPAI